MRRIALGKHTPLVAAVILFWGAPFPCQAAQDDPLREELIKISQVTGEDAFKGQLADLLKDKNRAKTLVAAGVSMANAGDTNMGYYGALTMAKIAVEIKDFKACETLYRVAMAKSLQLYSKAKVLQSYGGLIDALYSAKKYADAARFCTELLEVKTGADGRRFLFLVEDRFGDVGFEIDPNFDLVKPLRLTIHELRIQALTKEGKHDQALKQVENLVRASDGWEERQLLGWVLREVGQVSKAAKVYEDVVERIGKDEELTQKGKDEYGDLYRYILSGVYVEAKQIDKAADLLKGLIERHPDDAGYYNDLGYFWADNDLNLKEAETMIRKALELDREARKKSPDYVAAEDRDKGSYLDSLGWVLFKQKRYEDAKKYLIEALTDKKAQHIEIFDHLGDTYQVLGQRDAAVEAWKRGLAVAGDDRLEKERKALVEKKIQKASK